MLHIEPGRSPGLAGALTVMHVVAAGSVALSAVPTGLAVVSWLALSASLAWYLRALAPGRRAVQAARVDGDGSWYVELQGETRPVTLHPDTYVHPWLVILRFRGLPAGSRVLLVPRDAVSAETFRRLRVLLNLTRPAADLRSRAARLLSRAAWDRGSSEPADPDPSRDNRACSAGRDSRGVLERTGR